MNIIDNDLLSIQEARILVENAKEAQDKMKLFSQAKLDRIVEGIAVEMLKHLEELAILSSEETDSGKWEDKYLKNKFVCENLIRKFKNINYVGIIKEDLNERILDIGVPIGVIIALCPSNSPVSTTIYKTLIAIKTGNSIIFSPNLKAKKSISRALDIMKNIAKKYELPDGGLSYLNTVTKSGIKELINHEYTDLIINTGVTEVMEEANRSGKHIIYGGTGNGIVFIERTANINKAVKDIVLSKSFDNGLSPASEQAVVIDGCIDHEVKKEFIKNGAYFMNEREAEALGKKLFEYDGSCNPEAFGKSAFTLAKRSGFEVPEYTKILISEQKYVSLKNPYSKEKLCPVLSYYVEDDWMNACEKCIELLLTEKTGHTLVVHSNDENVIREFALKKPVGRMLVNTSSTFGATGVTTNLFPSMTLGSGLNGKGMTSDNVSPTNLIYIRKVAYGVKDTDNILKTFSKGINHDLDLKKSDVNDSEKLKFLYKMLKEALENKKQ